MTTASHDDITFDLIEHDGRPPWLTSTGRILPYIAGGAGEGEGGDGGEAGEGGEGSGGDGGAGSGQGSGGSESGTGGTTEGREGDEGGDEKLTLTQAELDRMIDKRLGRAKTKWETDLKTFTEAENQTETQRLEAEKQAAEQRAQEVAEKANAKLVLADAKVAAVGAGAKPDRVAALLKLVDLSDIDVDDDGTPDAKAIEKAVKKGLDEYPEFKAGAANGRGGNSGGEFNGGNGATKPGNLEEAVAARYS